MGGFGVKFVNKHLTTSMPKVHRYAVDILNLIIFADLGLPCLTFNNSVSFLQQLCILELFLKLLERTMVLN